MRNLWSVDQERLPARGWAGALRAALIPMPSLSARVALSSNQSTTSLRRANCTISRHPCKSFVKLRHGCPRHAQESVQVNSPRMFHTQKYASRQSVPALGRTRHPFAVSDSEEPSQKIEFVFSASPETIRREPREFDLLRSVGKMQDLAVCAWFILFVSGSLQAAAVLRSSAGIKSLCSRSTASR
jgi:hypothetical protein